MKIYNPSGVQIADLIVSDESYRYRAIMGENALTLTFSLPSFVEIPVGSYADFQSERYTLLKRQNFTKNNSSNFEYTLILDGAQKLLGKFKFRDSNTGKLKFSLTARPQEFLEMLVDNLNQRDNGWSVGAYTDQAEKVISFNHNYCDDALRQMAEAFNTEYEVVGKTISLKKIEYNKNNPLSLSYGFGNGFKSGIKRDNASDSKAIEILFVQGGDKNIDASKYGSQELLLPISKTISYDGDKFEDEQGFNALNSRTYISDENGYYIKRSDKQLNSEIEDSIDLSNIYPKRVGTVSSVIVVNESKNFYDFTDNLIPLELDYKSCLIAGEKMTVIFQTGMLTGKEFDVAYIHASRKFQIVPQEIDGETMPSSIWAPAVGDEYAVFGIQMPAAYIENDSNKSGGSWDLFREAVKYLYNNEDDKFSFTGEIDEVWAASDWVNIGGKIKLGGYISFSDEQFQTSPVLIRITGIKDFINNPYYPQIELSNVTSGGGYGSMIKDIVNTPAVIDNAKQDVIRYAKRGFREAKETADMIQASLLNFSGAISPITVQTMQLLVGDESLQFDFVANSGSTTAIAHSETFNATTKQFVCDAGTLQHKTLGITSISSSHSASEYKWWYLPFFTSAVLSDSSKSYYVYAKVSKSSNSGVFILSESAIAIEQVAGFYHLLVGILNSENDGDRSYSAMYGYSELTPGRLIIKKVISPSGKTFFDLENEVIQGNLKFQSGQSVSDSIASVQISADEAYSYADNAYVTAQNAQNGADSALSQLTNIVSDNMLSGSEKPAERLRWNSIVSEKSGINQQAASFGITTENATFNTAFQALANYMNGGVTWTSGVPSWISDANISTDTAINGTVYRQKWNDYYTARQSLLNAIYAKAKSLADAAQASVDGLQIGGVNTFTNDESKMQAWSDDGTHLFAKNDPECYYGFYFGGNQAVNNMCRLSNVISENGYWTVSWEMRGSQNTQVGVSVDICDNNSTLFLTTGDNSWKKYSLTVYVNNYSSDVYNFVDFQNFYWAYFYIRNIQVERGNKATSFKVAPIVIQSQIDSANSLLSDITSDSKLTPDEKQQLKKEWDAIYAEYPIISQRAYDIIGQANNYDDAYTHLETFITPLLANITTTSDVNGATLRAYFRTYYLRRTEVDDQIQNMIDAQSRAADYLRIALGSSTDITGGIVATNVLLMKSLDGAIKAGLSGLANDNVGYWSGGTYAQAQAGTAMNIDRKDGSWHRAGGKIGSDKNGNTRIGNFRIIGGNIVGYNSGGAEKIILSTDDISDLSELTTGGWVLLNDSTSITTSGKVPASGLITNAVTVEITVPYQTTVSFNRSNTLSLLVDGVEATNFDDPQSQPDDVQHLKIMKGNFTVYDSSYYYYLYEFVRLQLDAGVYTVTITTSCNAYDGLTGGEYELTGGLSGITYSEVIAKTKFGNNGFYSYWGANTFFYFSQATGLKVRGPVDMPGVPSTIAYISWNGGIARQTGRVQITCSKTGTGYYSIQHKLGKSAIYALLTPVTASTNVVLKIHQITTTLVDVFSRDIDSSVGVDADFVIAIYEGGI